MLQKRNTSIVKVSHIRQPQSFDIKKKHSRNIIHITIRKPTTIHSTHTNNFYSVNTNSSRKANSTKTSRLSKSTKITNTEIFANAVVSTYKKNSVIVNENEKGMTNDYHHMPKNKKKNKLGYSRRCFVGSSLTIGLLLLIVTAILLGLLMKPKANKTTIIPNAAPLLRWNIKGITIAGIVGNPGLSNNQLHTPLGIILDYANNMYIADTYNCRIQKYSLGSLTGQTVAGNGTCLPTQYLLFDPVRVILDSDENLYITDRSANRIQFWPKGSMSGKTVAGVTSSPGNSSNQLNFPYGISLHPITGVLYIADYLNCRIMSYAPGSNNGTLVFGGVGCGTSNTQLSSAVGLFLDSVSNSLIIGNNVALNVVRYIFGATNWIKMAGNGGTHSTSFAGETEELLDPMGNLYVADRNNHRIQFFQAGQINATTIAGITAVNGSNATTLDWHWSLRLDSQLNLYVADTNNHRIQKFLRY